MDPVFFVAVGLEDGEEGELWSISANVASCVIFGEDDVILEVESKFFLERLPKKPKIRPEVDGPLRCTFSCVGVLGIGGGLTWKSCRGPAESGLTGMGGMSARDCCGGACSNEGDDCWN